MLAKYFEMLQKEYLLSDFDDQRAAIFIRTCTSMMQLS